MTVVQWFPNLVLSRPLGSPSTLGLYRLGEERKGDVPASNQQPVFGRREWPLAYNQSTILTRWLAPRYKQGDPGQNLKSLVGWYQSLCLWAQKSDWHWFERQVRYRSANALRHFLIQIPAKRLSQQDHLAYRIFERRLERDLSLYTPQKLKSPHRQGIEAGLERTLYYDHYLDMPFQGTIGILGKVFWKHAYLTEKALKSYALTLNPKQSWIRQYEALIHQPGYSSYPELLNDHQQILQSIQAFTTQKQLFRTPFTPKRPFVLSKDKRAFDYEEKCVTDLEHRPTTLRLNARKAFSAFPKAITSSQIIQLLYPGSGYLRSQGQLSSPKANDTLKQVCTSLKPYSYLTTHGWNNYVLGLMIDQGYFDDKPEQKLAALRRRYRNAVLAEELLEFMGMEGDSTLEQVKDRLGKRLNIPQQHREEVMDKLLKEPEQYLYRVMGEAMIKTLRQKAQAKEGANFSLLDFHERFLRCSPLPLPLIAELEFGVKLSIRDIDPTADQVKQIMLEKRHDHHPEHHADPTYSP